MWMCCTCSQQLETDLKIEREWRQTLQNDLHRERDSVAQLSTEALQINGLKKVRWGKINSGQDAMFFFKVRVCAYDGTYFRLLDIC